MNIDCIVDTKPMADKIGEVSKKVEHTTEAVVAMKAAVLAENNKATEHICQNVSLGFYSMMCSQISQKLAENKSRVEALLVELGHQKKRLLGIQHNMETDYHRISARYQRIMTNLNKQLKKRIENLDEPIFRLCEKEVASVDNRKFSIAASASTCQKEDVSLGQRLLASKLKEHSLQLVHSSSVMLIHLANYKQRSEQILIDNMPAENKLYHIPVAVALRTVDRSGAEDLQVCVAEKIPTIASQTIRNTIVDNFSNIALSNNLSNDKVDSAFRRLLEDGKLPQRIKDTMTSLANKGREEQAKKGD